MLNSGQATPLSILHHARGTIVHSQMRDLASEVLADLGLAAPEAGRARAAGLGASGGLDGRADGVAATALDARREDAWARYGILVGGGPAPGINGVIGAAATTASRSGARVVGILDGFKWIMEGDTRHVRELDEEGVADIHLRGGSILRTSRANPTKKPEHLANCVRALDRLGIDRLITIGGDDTASSANQLAAAAGGRLRVAHVPKTIDNDLPLPDRHSDLRLRDRARTRDRRGRAHPRGHAHDRPLVLHRDDGPQRGPPRARRRQGGGRAGHADPRGVPGSGRSGSRTWCARSRARS